MSSPRVVTTRADLIAELDAAGPGTVRAVVPTMGALHQGHAELVRTARKTVGPDGIVIVTVFVNPTQFAAGEDFDKYPRTLDADVDICTQAGADLIFAPSVSQMYPNGETTVTVNPGPLGSVLEGAVRPTHFQGVLTVVNKLFNLTRAQLSFFGEKDYQQLVLIRQMALDLSMEVEVIGVPTVREVDGLAMSSRNRYLSPQERSLAEIVPTAMDAGVRAANAGQAASDVIAEVTQVFSAAGVECDYVVVTDPELGPAPATGPGRLIIAARIGPVRLLDNTFINLGVRS
jgi:pantoate--beta-alanine ligase